MASGEFQGILVQPIYGAGLVAGVEAAIAAGIPVGNVDRVLGHDMTTSDAQVDGLVGERRLRARARSAASW